MITESALWHGDKPFPLSAEHEMFWLMKIKQRAWLTRSFPLIQAFIEFNVFYKASNHSLNHLFDQLV